MLDDNVRVSVVHCEPGQKPLTILCGDAPCNRDWSVRVVDLCAERKKLVPSIESTITVTLRIAGWRGVFSRLRHGETYNVTVDAYHPCGTLSRVRDVAFADGAVIAFKIPVSRPFEDRRRRATCIRIEDIRALLPDATRARVNIAVKISAERLATRQKRQAQMRAVRDLEEEIDRETGTIRKAEAEVQRLLEDIHSRRETHCACTPVLLHGLESGRAVRIAGSASQRAPTAEPYSPYIVSPCAAVALAVLSLLAALVVCAVTLTWCAELSADVAVLKDQHAARFRVVEPAHAAIAQVPPDRRRSSVARIGLPDAPGRAAARESAQDEELMVQQALSPARRSFMDPSLVRPRRSTGAAPLAASGVARAAGNGSASAGLGAALVTYVLEDASKPNDVPAGADADRSSMLHRLEPPLQIDNTRAFWICCRARDGDGSLVCGGAPPSTDAERGAAPLLWAELVHSHESAAVEVLVVLTEPSLRACRLTVLSTSDVAAAV